MNLLAKARKQLRLIVGGVAVAVAVTLAIVFLATGGAQVPPTITPLPDSSPQGLQVGADPAPASSAEQADPVEAAPASAGDQAPDRRSNDGRTTEAPQAKEQLTVVDTVAVSVAEHGAGPDADSRPGGPEKTAASTGEDPATGESSKGSPAASSESPGQGGLTEGIGVRTSGFIEIRDPDGTLVSRQEFK